MRNTVTRAIHQGRRSILVVLLCAAVALSVAVSGAIAAPKGTPKKGKENVSTATKYSPEQAKAIKAWAHSLAVQAGTFAAPIVGMYNLRQTVATGPNPKAKPGTLWRLPNITTPKIAEEAGYVTPNVNTIYGFGFMDLSREPVVVTAPDSHGRYYMIEIVDMWDNAFAYAAGKKVGYKGGKYAIVGPGWKGTLPQGVKRIDSPTPWVEIQPRVHVKNQADLATAQKVLKAITVQGLAEYEGKPAPAPKTYHYVNPKLNPKVASSQLTFQDPLQFWAVFVDAMNENPPPKAMIDVVLPGYKYLGIKLGKKWNPDDVDPLFLEEMKKVGSEIGPMISNLPYLIGPNGNGWIATPYNFGAATIPPGADFLTAAVNAVLGLTANTASEAFYIWSSFDYKLVSLTGKKKYTMTLPADFPYFQVIPPGFWSVTMYDAKTRLTVENPINRYSLGSDNDLKKNKDGSITIYLQKDSPGKDKESNWLPTPAGPFYMLMRNYAPNDAAFEALKDPAKAKLLPKVIPVS
jgi:hypothetical protein